MMVIIKIPVKAMLMLLTADSTLAINTETDVPEIRIKRETRTFLIARQMAIAIPPTNKSSPMDHNRTRSTAIGVTSRFPYGKDGIIQSFIGKIRVELLN
jgi:hypothetical protein